MDNDIYGRTVVKQTIEDMDFYIVSGDNGSFTIEVPKDTDSEQVYNTINAMAPG